MIVFGDPRYRESAASLLAELNCRLNRARQGSVDGLRGLLIRAGQFEQAICDLWPEPDSIQEHAQAHATLATDCIASAFFSAWSGTSTRLRPGSWRAAGHDALQEAAEWWGQIRLGVDTMLEVKVPEGFAYYALFPEQYCASALKWASDHGGTWPRHVAVVGVRSIGTTLSAVVAAALKAIGWGVTRITVRPGGLPFERQLAPADLKLPFVKCAIVVDEGPGLSGSSMAAVACALESRRITDIVFMPGHASGPGSAASAETRRVWSQIPSYFTPLDELGWDGVSLMEFLVRETRALTGISEALEVRDVSAGRWRSLTFPGQRLWPAVAGRFERMKYLCGIPGIAGANPPASARPGSSNATDEMTDSGRELAFRPLVLWKFAGLDCGCSSGAISAQSCFNRLLVQSKDAWTPAPLGALRGFVAVPWVEGRRLGPADAVDATVLQHVARYLVRTAAPGLTPEQSVECGSRLSDMLYWNVREALNELAAEKARRDAAIVEHCACPFAYADGRPAPHEWIRTPGGRLFKTDSTGHQDDHTIIGPQPLLWDIAGVVLEWDLNPGASAQFLSALEGEGLHVNAEALQFYLRSYAAFRMGLMSMAADQAGEGEDRNRLCAARGRYRDRLAALLA